MGMIGASIVGDMRLRTGGGVDRGDAGGDSVYACVRSCPGISGSEPASSRHIVARSPLCKQEVASSILAGSTVGDRVLTFHTGLSFGGHRAGSVPTPESSRTDPGMA